MARKVKWRALVKLTMLAIGTEKAWQVYCLLHTPIVDTSNSEIIWVLNEDIPRAGPSKLGEQRNPIKKIDVTQLTLHVILFHHVKPKIYRSARRNSKANHAARMRVLSRPARTSTCRPPNSNALNHRLVRLYEPEVDRQGSESWLLGYNGDVMYAVKKEFVILYQIFLSYEKMKGMQIWPYFRQSEKNVLVVRFIT